MRICLLCCNKIVCVVSDGCHKYSDNFSHGKLLGSQKLSFRWASRKVVFFSQADKMLQLLRSKSGVSGIHREKLHLNLVTVLLFNRYFALYFAFYSDTVFKTKWHKLCNSFSGLGQYTGWWLTLEQQTWEIHFEKAPLLNHITHVYC